MVSSKQSTVRKTTKNAAKGPNAAELFKILAASQKTPRIAESKESLDAEIQKIFRQASKHREWLIKFYITYTSILSFAVVALIFWQAHERLLQDNTSIELIPQSALNLIVVGMFGQFIGLLTIVTKKVWEYKSFLDHVQGGAVDSSRKK